MKNGKKIRFLELHNHYPDDYVDNINSVLGRYCAFGYHDAISISEVDEMTEDLGLWNKRSDIVSKKINGTSTMQVISVLFDVENEKKNKIFGMKKMMKNIHIVFLLLYVLENLEKKKILVL